MTDELLKGLLEVLAKHLFKSPTFREQLQLWFTETVRDCEWTDLDDVERICKNVLRDEVTFSIDVNV